MHVYVYMLIKERFLNKKMLPGAKKRVMQRKEPAKRLTLEQKLELIKHAKNGVKNFELCKMYNICKSSVTEILRKKEIYLSQFEKRRKLSGRIDTKKCTGTYDTPFEISVFYWFLQRRTLGEPVSSMLLKEFAKKMHRNFYKETDFQASDGWLRGFKDRHGIKTLNTKGEKLSADTEEPQAYYLGLNERVMQRKEPAKRLTLEQKLELINHAKNGVKNVELCKMYNICKSSVTEILGKKEIYLSEFEKRRQFSGRIDTKKCTGTYDTPFERSVFDWFLQRRTLGEPVSGVLLKEFAKKMHKNFYEETNFQASDGWLRGFKDRHGIRMLKTKGEKLSADTEEAQAYYLDLNESVMQRKEPAKRLTLEQKLELEFKDRQGIRTLNIKGEKLWADTEEAQEFYLGLNAFIKDNAYDYDNIYNADETAYYYKHLPTKTLVARDEIEAPGHEEVKDRLTLQVCANATGTDKVPLMVIGKAAKPRCIKHVDDLPVFYKGQNKGWMNQNLFIYWYTEIFLPHIKARKPGEHERFLLILDNAPAHLSAEILNEIDPQCMVFYLPPSVTSIIQPMNQGVISSLKRKCKMAYLREILGNTSVDTCGMAEFIKSWTIKDCLFLIYQAWSDVSAETLRNAWGKLIDQDMPHMNSCQDPTLEACNLLNKLPKSKEISLEDTDEWLQADSTEDTWRRLSEEEIIAAAQGYPIQDDSDTELEENENDGNNDHDVVKKRSKKELILAALILNDWIKHDPESDVEECKMLLKLKQRILKSQLH